jgi:energy-coupling factor transport system permease protein
LRRSEEFTNALVARGYAFTGEASRIKRADYVLTHYSFKYYDAIFTAIISIAFIVLLIMRFKYNYFAIEQSTLLNWLHSVL